MTEAFLAHFLGGGGAFGAITWLGTNEPEPVYSGSFLLIRGEEGRKGGGDVFDFLYVWELRVCVLEV